MASQNLLSNRQFDKLKVNKLEVEKLKTNFINDKIKPLVFYSIPSSSNKEITLKLINKNERYNNYILEIPVESLNTTVVKRVHEYYPVNSVYWTLLKSSKQFLDDLVIGFKEKGDNFDVDNIGNIVPGTFNNKSNLAVCHLLYIENDKSYQINLFVQNVVINKETNNYEFKLVTDRLSKTFSNVPHNESHKMFEDEYHFHAFPGDETEIIIPEKTLKTKTWSFELYLYE